MKKVLFLLSSILLAPDLRPETPVRLVSDYLRDSKFAGDFSWWKPDERMIEFEQGLNCFTAKHNYLWYKDRFVVQLDGTGRVYRDDGKDSVERMDKTCYEGYNFGAYTFVYKDTLFSLGGYGFWQVSNQLRFYDERVGEWAVIPSNKIFPFQMKHYSHVYLDRERHKLYIAYHDPGAPQPHTTAPYKKKLFVQCLDLDTKLWWEEPKTFVFQQDQDFDVTYWLLRTGIPIRQGLLLVMQNEAFVLDFAHNKGYKLNTYTHQNIMSLIGTLTTWLIISETSGPTFFHPQTQKFYHVDIPDSSLVPQADELYVDQELNTNSGFFSAVSYWLIIGLLSTVLLLLFYRHILLRSRLRAVTSANGSNPQVSSAAISQMEVNKPVFRDNLTEIEAALLDVLIANSSKEENTSVDEINRALGLSKKTNRVQNNIRAATLLMINKKFMVFSGVKEELIQKERTPFDKRIYEYFIPKKYLPKIKNNGNGNRQAG